jgi:structural maintenance of chromosome 4
MKPKRSDRSEEDGMLEYLEDIIGSSRLKLPIEKFKRKIDSLTNKEEMVQKKLKLAETEVTTLKEPVRKVLRLMKLENAITKTKHKIFSLDRFAFNSQLI